MSTKNPCRAKDPSKCPYHGAPLVIESFHAALQTGRDLTSAEVQEYLAAADAAKESQRRTDRILALREAAKEGSTELSRNLRASLAKEVKGIKDEEELLAAVDLIFEDENSIKGPLSGRVGAAFLRNPRLSAKNRIELARRLGDGDAVASAVLDESNEEHLRQLYQATKGSKGQEPISTAGEVFESFMSRPVPSDIKAEILENNPGYINYHVADNSWDDKAYAAANKIIDSSEVGPAYEQLFRKLHGSARTTGTPVSKLEGLLLAEAPREVALKVVGKWVANPKLKTEEADELSANFISNPNVTFADVKAHAADLYVGEDWQSNKNLAKKADIPEAAKKILKSSGMEYIPEPLSDEEARTARNTYRNTPPRERTWKIDAAFGRSYASWHENIYASRQSRQEEAFDSEKRSYWSQAETLGTRSAENFHFQAVLAAE